MSELKRCPFCGCELKRLSHYYIHPSNNCECIIYFLAIDILGEDFEDKVKAWNRRV